MGQNREDGWRVYVLARQRNSFVVTWSVPMKSTYGLLGFIFLLSALPIVVGCNKQNAQAAGPQLPLPVVTVARATAHDVPVYLDEIGKSGAFESVTVTPQVAGRILERHFQDGAELKKDQLLFTVDPRPYQAQLDVASAELAQSKAALDLANTQLKMYASISDTRAVSQLDFETKKNTVALDEAQMQAAQAAVENAQLNLDYCYIHSPIDGRAGARLVDAGNVVQANTTGLLLIQRLDPIYADFTITERDIPEVQRQMSRGTLKTLVRLPSDPQNSSRAGMLTFLDNAVQNATGTVNLRATVSNPDQHFWPGQFVNVTLILATDKGAVLIPNQAAQISQQGAFVYVVKPDDTIELRQVTLGQRQGDDVVVTQGLADGERTVVTGQLAVVPGAKVRIVAAAPTTDPAANQPSSGGGNGSKGGKE
jgi:membrane fusion protein, multidrug efflux system